MTRETAINKLNWALDNNTIEDVQSAYEYIIALKMAIKALEQEPKTGHWIEVTNGRGGHECNICHEYAPSYRNGDDHLTKYCPNCGAKMIDQQESEVKK